MHYQASNIRHRSINDNTCTSIISHSFVLKSQHDFIVVCTDSYTLQPDYQVTKHHVYQLQCHQHYNIIRT